MTLHITLLHSEKRLSKSGLLRSQSRVWARQGHGQVLGMSSWKETFLFLSECPFWMGEAIRWASVFSLVSHLFPPREGAKAASPRESEEHVTLGGHLHPPRPTLCPLDYVSQPSSAMQFPFHSTRDQAAFQAQDRGGGLSPSGCPAAVAEGHGTGASCSVEGQ